MKITHLGAAIIEEAVNVCDEEQEDGLTLKVMPQHLITAVDIVSHTCSKKSISPPLNDIHGYYHYVYYLSCVLSM